MLTKKLQIATRIYKQFYPSFSQICYYLFIFSLLWISIGLSVFGFVANKYQWRAIQLLSTIRNIRSAIRWAIPKVILNYSLIIISMVKWGIYNKKFILVKKNSTHALSLYPVYFKGFCLSPQFSSSKLSCLNFFIILYWLCFKIS